MICLITPQHDDGSESWESPCNDLCMCKARKFDWKGRTYEVILRDCNAGFNCSFDVREFIEEILKSDGDGADLIYDDRDHKLTSVLVTQLRIPVDRIRIALKSVGIAYGAWGKNGAMYRISDLDAIARDMIPACAECQKKMTASEWLNDWRSPLEWLPLTTNDIFVSVFNCKALRGPGGYRIAEKISSDIGTGVVCGMSCKVSLLLRRIDAAQATIKGEREWLRARRLFDEVRVQLREKLQGACR